MDLDELFDAWDRAWSGRDPKGFESICNPDVHYEDPLTESPLIGTRRLAKHARQLWKALPDARVNSTGNGANGTFVANPCRILGTHLVRSGGSTRRRRRWRSTRSSTRSSTTRTASSASAPSTTSTAPHGPRRAAQAGHGGRAGDADVRGFGLRG